uniref:NADH dehydrogenase [ubiquinone] 1 alpha subcomplex subunit 2 n=1 Tax=Aquila chrysaetos chrysaetos TaxID=223781 RepID=A0A663EMC0_AQUCH
MAAVVRGIGGGLGRSLRELRIHLCQRSPGSRGVRDFIEQHYVTLKKANPDFPILIRECSGVEPKLWARYEFGKEKSVPLNNLTVDEVAKVLENIVKSKEEYSQNSPASLLCSTLSFTEIPELSAQMRLREKSQALHPDLQQNLHSSDRILL